MERGYLKERRAVLETIVAICEGRLGAAVDEARIWSIIRPWLANLMNRLLEAELIYGRLLTIAEAASHRALKQGADRFWPEADGA